MAEMEDPAARAARLGFQVTEDETPAVEPEAAATPTPPDDPVARAQRLGFAVVDEPEAPAPTPQPSLARRAYDLITGGLFAPKPETPPPPEVLRERAAPMGAGPTPPTATPKPAPVDEAEDFQQAMRRVRERERVRVESETGQPQFTEVPAEARRAKAPALSPQGTPPVTGEDRARQVVQLEEYHGRLKAITDDLDSAREALTSSGTGLGTYFKAQRAAIDREAAALKADPILREAERLQAQYPEGLPPDIYRDFAPRLEAFRAREAAFQDRVQAFNADAKSIGPGQQEEIAAFNRRLAQADTLYGEIQRLQEKLSTPELRETPPSQRTDRTPGLLERGLDALGLRDAAAVEERRRSIAAARATIERLAREAGVSTAEYRNPSPRIPGQYLTGLADATFGGLGGALLHAYGFDEDAPEGIAESLAKGAGQLTGFIGPGAIVAGGMRAARTAAEAGGAFMAGEAFASPALAAARKAYTATLGPVLEPLATDSVRRVLVKHVLEEASVLGAASTLSAAGEAAQSQDVLAAARVLGRAGRDGAMLGAVFGGVQGILPGDSLGQLAARYGVGMAALDALHAQHPFDERELAQKAYDYGLNAFFLFRGRDPKKILEGVQAEAGRRTEENRARGSADVVTEDQVFRDLIVQARERAGQTRFERTADIYQRKNPGMSRTQAEYWAARAVMETMGVSPDGRGPRTEPAPPPDVQADILRDRAPKKPEAPAEPETPADLAKAAAERAAKLGFDVVPEPEPVEPGPPAPFSPEAQAALDKLWERAQAAAKAAETEPAPAAREPVVPIIDEANLTSDIDPNRVRVIEADDAVVTASGRRIPAPPEINAEAETLDDRAQQRWLVQQGLQEAAARQDAAAQHWMLQERDTLRAQKGGLPPAVAARLHDYLFGHEAPVFMRQAPEPSPFTPTPPPNREAVEDTLDLMRTALLEAQPGERVLVMDDKGKLMDDPSGSGQKLAYRQPSTYPQWMRELVARVDRPSADRLIKAIDQVKAGDLSKPLAQDVARFAEQRWDWIHEQYGIPVEQAGWRPGRAADDDFAAGLEDDGRPPEMKRLERQMVDFFRRFTGDEPDPRLFDFMKGGSFKDPDTKATVTLPNLKQEWGGSRQLAERFFEGDVDRLAAFLEQAKAKAATPEPDFDAALADLDDDAATDALRAEETPYGAPDARRAAVQRAVAAGAAQGLTPAQIAQALVKRGVPQDVVQSAVRAHFAPRRAEERHGEAAAPTQPTAPTSQGAAADAQGSEAAPGPLDAGGGDAGRPGGQVRGDLPGGQPEPGAADEAGPGAAEGPGAGDGGPSGADVRGGEAGQDSRPSGPAEDRGPIPRAAERAADRAAGQPSLPPRLVTIRPRLTRRIADADVAAIVPPALLPHLSDAQRQGVARAILSLSAPQGGHLDASGTGSGKSRRALAVAAHFAAEGAPVMIVSPAGALKIHPKTRAITGTIGVDAERMGVPVQVWDRQSALDPGAIYATTYEGFKLLAPDQRLVLIFDEAHRLKNALLAPKAEPPTPPLPGQAPAKPALPAQGVHGVRLASAARAVYFLTATPIDKGPHIVYLERAGVFEGQPMPEAMKKLGMVLQGGAWRALDASRTEMLIEQLFDRLTRDGLMTEHVLSMEGVAVNFRPVSVGPAIAKTMQDIEDGLGRGMEATGLLKARILMAQRLHHEPGKIDEAVRMTQAALSRGRQVILFMARVNEAETGRWVRDAYGEKIKEIYAKSEGTAKTVVERLKTAGITDIAQMHGQSETTQAEAMRQFQEGEARVLVATIESGGTGINLDDKVGDKPRTMIMLTPPFSAVDFMQAVGRPWRADTMSFPEIEVLHSHLPVDEWNLAIVSQKLGMLGAAVQGDITRLDPDQALMHAEEAPYGEHPETGAYDWGWVTPDGREVSSGGYDHEDALWHQHGFNRRDEDRMRKAIEAGYIRWSVGGPEGEAILELDSRHPEVIGRALRVLANARPTAIYLDDHNPEAPRVPMDGDPRAVRAYLRERAGGSAEALAQRAGGAAPERRQAAALDAWAQAPVEPGYVYHATNAERAADIAAEGIKTFPPHYGTDQDAWPDGGRERRAYFAASPTIAASFPPEGRPVLLRVPVAASMRPEAGTGDIISRKKIPARGLEALAADNTWQPLATFFSQALEAAEVPYDVGDGAPQDIPEDIRRMPLYHATSSEAAGQAILASGRLDPDVGPEDKRRTKGFLAPVRGKVYFAQDQRYPAIYALGGVFMGHEMDERYRDGGEHGYIFRVDGAALRNVQPDEDSIGEMLSEAWNDYSDVRAKNPSLEPRMAPAPEWLRRLARQYLNAREIQYVKGGEYLWFARAGKRLMRYLSDAQKFELIRRGAKIAHHGALPIAEAWRLDKRRSAEIRPDGSNLFDIAEPVEVPQVQAEETPYGAANPFADKARRARALADRLSGTQTAHDKGMADAFPLGAGFGHGSQRSRDRKIDASVNRAVTAVQAERDAQFWEARAAAFDRGEINAQGRAWDADKQARSEKREAAKESRGARIAAAKAIRADKPQWEVPVQAWANAAGYFSGPAYALIQGEHREAVEQALADGRWVPAEVLADYPDFEPAAPAEPAFEATPEGQQALVPGAPRRAVPDQKTKATKAQRDVADTPLFGLERANRERENDAAQGSLFDLTRIEGPEGEQRAVAGFDPRLIKTLSGNLYSGDLGKIAVKEMLQNAVDSVRGLPDPTGGQITVAINSKTRVIEVSDTGVGMLPSVATEALVNLGGSDKPEGASGGFGIAKAAIFYNADQISVITRAIDARGHLITTQLSGTGDDWIDQTKGLKVKTEDLGPAAGLGVETGTDLRIQLKAEAQMSEYEVRPFLRTFLSHKRLPMTITARMDGEELAPDGDRLTTDLPAIDVIYTKGAAFEYSVATTNNDWASQSLYVQVLNNGLPQFALPIYLPREVKVPTEVVVNVKATGSPEEADYPFSPDRESLRRDALKAVSGWVKDVLFRKLAARESDTIFGSLERGARIGLTGRQRVIDTDGTLSDELLKTLALARYAEPLNRIIRKGLEDMADVIAGMDTSTEWTNYVYGGFGTGTDYLGVNVNGSGLKDAGVDLGKLFGPGLKAKRLDAEDLKYDREAQRPHLLLFNPWRVAWETKRAVDQGLVPNAERVDNFAGALAATMLHELTHNIQKGHGEAFAGDLTRAIGKGAALVLKTQAAVKKLLAKDGGNGFDQILDDLSLLEPAWERGGKNVFGQIASGARSAAGSGDGEGAAQPGADGRGDAGAAAPGVPGDNAAPAGELAAGAGVGGRGAQVDTPAFKRWFGASKVVDAAGRPKVVYRGDYRADTVGNVPRIRKATSGRFYFTEDPAIASNYAKDKPDTHQTEAREAFADHFTFPNRYGRGRVNAERLWWQLSADEKAQVRDAIRSAYLDDDGALQFGEESAYDDGHWTYMEPRGLGTNVNWIAKGIDHWLMSGMLFSSPEEIARGDRDEARFLQILEHGGLRGGLYDNPWDPASAVTPAYLSIQRPLDTAAIPTEVVERLRAVARADRTRGRGEHQRVDMWDKNRNAKVFMERLEDDLRNGTTHAWTSVPEKITQALQALGYDGVKDTGGKMGGAQHTVWIAFEPTQIKSAIGNRGTFDPTKANILQAEEQPYGAATDTQAFKRWFGASKIVDENGRPQVMYHGGASGIEVFDPGKAGTVKRGDWGQGIYLTPARWMADGYREDAALEADREGDRLWEEYEAAAARLGTTPMNSAIDLGYNSERYNSLRPYEQAWRARRDEVRRSGGGAVYAVYVRMVNPLWHTAEGITDPWLAEKAKAEGHDGIVVDRGTAMEEVVVFSPNQLKSATDNSGAYDPADPNILRAEEAPYEADPPAAGPVVDGLRVLDDIPNRGSIEATLGPRHLVLPGVRSVPLAWFDSDPRDLFYAADDRRRVERLAAQIRESGAIKPLIVVLDRDGAYVLEGGHRLGALHTLGKTTLPALVVRDMDALHAEETPYEAVNTQPQQALARLTSRLDPGPQWVSRLRGVVDAKMPNSATVDQVKAILKGPGIKADEVKWTGIGPWLDSRTGKVSKAEVLDYLDRHAVTLEDVLLGPFPKPIGTGPRDALAKLDAIKRRENALMSDPDATPTQLREIAVARREAEAAVVALHPGSHWSDMPSPQNPKFKTYTLPGGKDYRELLLRWLRPTPDTTGWEATHDEVLSGGRRQPMGGPVAETWAVIDAAGQPRGRFRGATPEEAIRAAARFVASSVEGFRSSHFDTPDIVAHLRAKDRTATPADPARWGGKKKLRVFALEEIQSDWHEQGREKGYIDPAAGDEVARLDKEIRANTKRVREIAAAANEEIVGNYFTSPDPLRNRDPENLFRVADVLDQTSPEAAAEVGAIAVRQRDLYAQWEAAEKRTRGVPAGPYAKTWPELALKRALRWAAEHGYDAVAWTPGSVQAERYNLGAHIAALSYRLEGDTWQVNTTLPGGAEHQGPARRLKDAELNEFLGREVADKMRAGEGTPTWGPDLAAFSGGRAGRDGFKTLSGLDLDVGGHGMRAFYDKMLQNVMRNYVKQWGVGVETLPIEVAAGRGSAEREAVGEITGYQGPDIHRDDLAEITREQVDQFIYSNPLPAGHPGGAWSNGDEQMLWRVLGDLRRHVIDGMSFRDAMMELVLTEAATPEHLHRFAFSLAGRYEQATKIKRTTKPVDFWAVPITPAMRAAVLGGQPVMAEETPYGAGGGVDSRHAPPLDPAVPDDAGRLDNLDATQATALALLRAEQPAYLSPLSRLERHPARAGDGQSDRGGRGALRPPAPGVARVLGLSITQAVEMDGHVAFVGKKIRSVGDLVQAATLVRNPFYETSRFIAMQGNRVVGHLAVSSGLPQATEWRPTGAEVADIRAWMQHLGADGYYMMHNHPSGNTTPSRGDVSATKIVAAAIPGMRQHLVIDGDEFSLLDPDGEIADARAPYRAPTPEKLLVPSVPHPLLRTMIEDAADLMHFGQRLVDGQEDLVVAAVTDERNRVRGITLIHEQDLAGPRARGLLHELSLQMGGRRVFIYATPRSDATRDLLRRRAELLIKAGDLTDYADGASGALRHSIPNPAKYSAATDAQMGMGILQADEAPYDADVMADLEAIGREVLGQVSDEAAWTARMRQLLPAAYYPDLPVVYRVVGGRPAAAPSGGDTLASEPAAVETAIGIDAVRGVFSRRSSSADAVERANLLGKLQALISAPIDSGRMAQGKRVLGIFKIKPEVIRSRVANDLPTVTHELGHFISKRLFGPSNDPSPARAAFYALHEQALEQLSQTHGKPTPEEGIAEWMRHYLSAPDATRQNYPAVTRDLLDRLRDADPDLLDGLEAWALEYRAWRGSSLLDRAMGHIRHDGDAVPVDDARTLLHNLYSAVWDDTHHVQAITEKLLAASPDIVTADQNPAALIETFRHNMALVERFLFRKKGLGGAIDFGTRQRVGDSLEEVLRPVRQEWRTFEGYMILRRLKELEGRPDARGQRSARALHTALETYPAELQASLDEIERDHPAFAGAHDAYQTWNRQLLDYLTASQVISPDARQAIEELNKSYFPFHRFFADKALTGPATKKGPLGKPIKTLMGSGREFDSPLAGSVRNAYSMVMAAERNAVKLALVQLAEKVDGSGKWIERVPPHKQMLKIPSTEAIAQIRQDLIDAGAAPELIELLDDAQVRDMITSFRADHAHLDDNEIVVMRRGKPVHYIVRHPGLKRELDALDRNEADLVGRLLDSFTERFGIRRAVDLAVAGPARLLRAGVTLSPEYTGRNLVRDFWSRVAYTRTPSKIGRIPVNVPGLKLTGLDTVGPFVDMLWQLYATGRGLKSAITKDAWHDALQRGGGQTSLAHMDFEELQKKLDDVMAGRDDERPRGWEWTTSPIKILRFASSLSEDAGRNAEGRDALAAQGVTDPRAASKAQLLEAGVATGDIGLRWSRQGWVFRSWGLNRIAAFFNPGWIAWEKLYRELRHNPIGFSWRMLMLITLPSLALWLWNHDDPRWEEIPQWQKDISWIVFTSKIDRVQWEAADAAERARLLSASNVIRIPKPFELGVLFGSVPERILDRIYGHNKDKGLPMALAQTLGAAIGTSVVGIPTQAALWLGAYSNWSGFFNRPIVPRALEQEAPEFQITAGTSHLAQWLAQSTSAATATILSPLSDTPRRLVPEMLRSPAMVDYLIKQGAGNVGRMAADLSDMAARAIDKNPTPLPTPTLADIPGIRGFAVRYPSASAESLNEFWETFKHAEQTAKSLDNADGISRAKRPRTVKTPSERASSEVSWFTGWLKNHEAGAVLAYGGLDGKSGMIKDAAELRTLQKELRSVWAMKRDQALAAAGEGESPEQWKRRRLDELTVQMIDTARKSLAYYRQTVQSLKTQPVGVE